MIEFDKVVKELVTASYNVATAERYGFVLTPESICLINTLNIVRHSDEVICNLSDEQVENLNYAYNHIKTNNLFKERIE